MVHNKPKVWELITVYYQSKGKGVSYMSSKESDNGEVGVVHNVTSDEEKRLSHDQLVDECIDKSFDQFDEIYKLLA